MITCSKRSRKTHNLNPTTKRSVFLLEYLLSDNNLKLKIIKKTKTNSDTKRINKMHQNYNN